MKHATARRTRRSLAAAGTLALVSVLAVGCGDDGGDAKAEGTETVYVDADGNPVDDPGQDQGDGQSDGPDVVDDSGPALTQEQVELAVLTGQNVGEGWTGGPTESDVESGAPGCFGEIERISNGLDPIEVAEHDVEYEYGDQGVPSISSGASSYEDGNAVGAAFDELSSVLAACTSVNGTDTDGNTWDFALTTDQTLATDTIDDQVNVTAVGTLTDTSGTAYDLTLHQSYVRIGKNVITVGVTGVSDHSELQTGYTEIAIDRLVAVIIDSDPSETTGPQPA